MAQKSNDAFLSAIEDVKKYLDDYSDREKLKLVLYLTLCV